MYAHAHTHMHICKKSCGDLKSINCGFMRPCLFGKCVFFFPGSQLPHTQALTGKDGKNRLIL